MKTFLKFLKSKLLQQLTYYTTMTKIYEVLIKPEISTMKITIAKDRITLKFQSKEQKYRHVEDFVTLIENYKPEIEGDERTARANFTEEDFANHNHRFVFTTHNSKVIGYSHK